MGYTEKFLTDLFDQLDELVLCCVRGETSLREFRDIYGYPIGEYALDGHESDEGEKALLANYAKRIAVHEAICNVFSRVCSDEDAMNNPLYREAGRVPIGEVFDEFLEAAKKIERCEI